MKPLHIGMLVVGAALAGSLAIRMAAPPAIPAHLAKSSKSNVKPVLSRSPAPPSTVQVSVPETAVAAPAAVSSPSPAVAPAPPPIFSEPQHVEQSPKRKPFSEAAIASAHPVPHMEPAHSPVIPPVEYRASQSTATVARTTDPPSAPTDDPQPVEPIRGEPPHVDIAPRQVSLQAGAAITVRLLETLSSEHAASGEVFQATLADPLVCDGWIVAERGARVTGRVTAARQAGRFGGVSSLELRLTDVTTADGQRIAIASDPWLKRGDSMARGSAEKIGGGAALGAVIGAIAGGGLGAAIGAGAGGTLGAGAQAITGGRQVTIPSETVIQFRLASPVRITERQL